MLGLKGLLERLITHFGLGSSKEEEPCGVWCLLGKDPASWEVLSWGSTPWGRALSCWETSLTSLEELPACLALSLAKCLTAWGDIGLSAWRVLSSREEGELALGELNLCWWEGVFFWGSLRIACLGECTTCRSAYLLGKPGECLPGRAHYLPQSAICRGSLGTTCLGTACLGEHTACQSAICWGSLGTTCLGTACLGECTPCWRKSAISQGSLGTACLEECTPCRRQSVIYWGSLGTACLGTACLGDSTPCQGKSVIFHRGLGTCLPGKILKGKCYELTCLPACCLPRGKTLAAWELCQVISPSFLLIRLLSFLTCLSPHIDESLLLDLVYEILTFLVIKGC